MHSNDPVNPTFELVLEGEISVDVDVQPRILSFGQLRKGETGKRDFTITITEPDKIKLKSVTIDDKRFEVKPIDEKTGKYELAFSGSKNLDRVNTDIKIAIEGSEVSSVNLPVRANIVGNLRYPKNIFFLRRGDEFKPRDIAITTRSGSPIKIKSANDSAGNLKLSVTQQTGQRTVVRAEVAKPDKKLDAPVEGTLTIKTTDKEEPEVQVIYKISESLGQKLHPPGQMQRQLPLPPQAKFSKTPGTSPSSK